MTPINKIEPISRIIPRQPIKKTEPITLKSMKQDLLALQYRAWKYNSWECYCIPRSKKDIGALKKGQSALKRGQLKNCQI